MRVISFVTQKGGAGKTTLAASLAIAAAKSRERVVMFDCDPQRSLTAWAKRRDDSRPLPNGLVIDAVPANRMHELRTFIERARKGGYTLAIIDTAGVDTPETHVAIEASTLCLIPAQPTMFDLAATRPTQRAIDRIGRDAAFVLNRCPTQRAASRTKEAASGLRAIGVLAEPPITQRNDHQDAIASGLGVTEFKPESPAAQEIVALWKWVHKTTKEAR